MKNEIAERTRRNMIAAGRRPETPWALVTFAVVAGFLGRFLTQAFGSPDPLLVILPALGCGAFCLAIHRQIAVGPYRTRALEDVIGLYVARHRAALSRNLARAVRRNDYGIVTADTRLKVIEEFLAAIGAEPDIIQPADALPLIETQLGELRQADIARSADFEMIPSDAVRFEHWVADLMGKAGWRTEVTQGSGDQGVDVIAEKDGVSVGIQCKLCSGTVGNKAVQEAIAGCGYYGLDAVAVLSNAPFTRGAAELARATGAVLMSNYDLADPDAKLMPTRAA